MPRKKIPADLRSLARGHTELCIKVLAGIVSQEAVPPAARVSAAGILLDRGWGKAPTTHTAPDGEGDIHVTIRHIIEETRNGVPTGRVIDAQPAPHALLANGDGEDEP